MTEALVFDAIRTPRGRGKVNGSLHSTKPVDLVVGLMHEMLSRNAKLDPNRVDDVVLGCVTPIALSLCNVRPPPTPPVVTAAVFTRAPVPPRPVPFKKVPANDSPCVC